MRLFEVQQKFGDLPQKAGIAVLNWKGSVASRDGKTITLPTHDDEIQFFPLLDGMQFLLQVPSIRQITRVFFGGTDEQPFLVEMDSEVITSLRGGEESFFNEIKPKGARVL